MRETEHSPDHTAPTTTVRPSPAHLLLWNFAWAAPRSLRGQRIRAIVAELDPDVVCLTEATTAMLPDDGLAQGLVDSSRCTPRLDRASSHSRDE